MIIVISIYNNCLHSQINIEKPCYYKVVPLLHTYRQYNTTLASSHSIAAKSYNNYTGDRARQLLPIYNRFSSRFLESFSQRIKQLPLLEKPRLAKDFGCYLQFIYPCIACTVKNRTATACMLQKLLSFSKTTWKIPTDDFASGTAWICQNLPTNY